MSALTAARDTKTRAIEFLVIAVAALTKVFQGGAVAIDASGNLNPAANTSGLKFIGIAEETVDNSAGGAGDLTAKVRQVLSALWDGTGFTDADLGKDVWFTYDNAVSLTPGYCYAGKIIAVESATSVWVDHRPAYAVLKPQAHIADVAATTQAALTDNGGGTADGTVASQAAPTALTDSTGYAATKGNTLAATTVPTKLTGTLTGTVDGAIADIAADVGACAGEATPSATQVDAAIAKAVAPIVTGTNTQLKELQTSLAAVIDLLAVMAQNASNNGQKINELVTLAGVARDNLKEVTTQLAAAKTDSDNKVTKINAVLASDELAGVRHAS